MSVMHPWTDDAEERTAAMWNIRTPKGRLPPAVSFIEQICAEEGATVTITGSNPDSGPNEVVGVCNDATGWTEKNYAGDTVVACLEAHLKEAASAPR